MPRFEGIDTDNTILSAKLQGGDMCAQDAVYHTDCFVNYTEIGRIGSDPNENDRRMHGLAFSKVISFIDEIAQSTEADTIPLFELPDLTRYYSDSLEKHGIKEYKAHSTRLKQRIMAHYDNMFEQSQGRDVVLDFCTDLNDIVSSARDIDFDNEGAILAQACKILCRDILEMSNTVFNGSFDEDCQENAIPDSLKCFLTEILHGNNTSKPHYEQPILSIGQLIRFNTIKRMRKISTSMYYSQDREPPFVVFLSEYIHSKTRSMVIIDTLSGLGLAVSKERLLQISTSLGNSSIDTFERDGVVVPVSLEKGLFCTSEIDNIDVDPRSAHAKSTLHGIAASINVHPVIDSDIQRETVPVELERKKLKQLPDDYTEIVPPVVTPPEVNIEANEQMLSEKELSEDIEWLEDNYLLPWSVFHARCEVTSWKFKEDARAPATIWHVLSIIIKAINF